MDNLLKQLSEENSVLDLGAGPGSFDYGATKASVVAIDLSFPRGAQPCDLRMVASAEAIPVRSNSLDLVICNNTLEHFESLEASLREVDRTLKPGKQLWASVPNGHSFDDGLYRFLYEGGGHLQRFTFESFIKTIESSTSLRATSARKLHTAMVYLNPPPRDRLLSLPKRSRILGRVPPGMLRRLHRWSNFLMRWMDTRFGTNLSHYGWSVTFEQRPPGTPLTDPDTIPLENTTLDVCYSCGASEDPATAGALAQKGKLGSTYDCRACGANNILSPGERPEADADLIKLLNTPPTPSPPELALRKEAERIFGDDHPESVDKWVQFWRDCRKRTEQMLALFTPIVLLETDTSRILDIGCGTGGLGEVLNGRCALYVGGDPNRHVLRFAQNSPKSSFVECSGTQLPLEDSSFDFVFALDVLEHVEPDEAAQIAFLQELRRVLKPLGMIFLSTPNRLYPREGHTGLIGPQYLPTSLADRYIAGKNPGFLREHASFAEITSLTPSGLRRCLRASGLSFLHQLPCALDRGDYLQNFPLRGLLSYLGLGWYTHAEFWGILVRTEQNQSLRRKLRKNWYYEQRQPTPTGVMDFQDVIDFEHGFFNPQLETGWFWHEIDQQGFRWIGKKASCFLQATGPSFLRISGYSQRPNRLRVKVNGVLIGVHKMNHPQLFDVEYLIPDSNPEESLYKVEIFCSKSFRATGDSRTLSAMIFSVGLHAEAVSPVDEEWEKEAV